ncbi:MAG: tyrosine-protein phosphatase [Chromatiaceae bacterium]|jgi:protein-tyrosine phosphatase|nr:tyrosine-protein phosphatase [Chromatiaceae bacterium]
MAEHPYDTFALDDGGAVILTPCPGTKGVGLRDSLADLARAGAQVVITLMPFDEMERHQVTELPELCREMGLHWFHFPIEDDAAPGESFRQAWERDKAEVLAILDQQGVSAVHCRGGSGRTGLMTALMLLERGMPYEKVVAEVRTLRPAALQLDVHLDYLQTRALGPGLAPQERTQ